MQSDTWEGEGQTGGLGTIRLPLGLQSAGPDLGSHHPGTTQTSAAGLQPKTPVQRGKGTSQLFSIRPALDICCRKRRVLLLKSPFSHSGLQGAQSAQLSCRPWKLLRGIQHPCSSALPPLLPCSSTRACSVPCCHFDNTARLEPWAVAKVLSWMSMTLKV